MANKDMIFYGNEGMIGPQCVGGIVYDDNTFENGIGNGPSDVKLAMKMTPPIYPYKINQICFALTRWASGSADWTFDIEVYDTTGEIGIPGNLVASIKNQTAIGVPVWPTVSWFDFTGITTIPPLNGGSYYIAICWDSTPNQGSHFVGYDESTTTPNRELYSYSSGTWSPFGGGSTKALGIRCSGIGQNYTHNLCTYPFLSLPAFFNAGTQKTIKAKVTNLGSMNETNVPIKFFVDGTQVDSTNINLNAISVDSATFNWTPTDTGTKTLKIVSALVTDQFRMNDTITVKVIVYQSGVLAYCYGTGTEQVTYPFTTGWPDARTQLLYTTAQVGTGPVNIWKFAFNIIYPYPQVMNSLSIRMQNTTLSYLTGFVSSGWTQVYNGNYSVPGSGWQFITLNPMFYYTGNNLLIEICYNNSNFAGSSTVASTQQSYAKVWHQSIGYISGDACVQFTTGSPKAYLPNICIIPYLTSTGNLNNEIPDKFSLSQNYPNPFNPSTKIRYQIPLSRGVDSDGALADIGGRGVSVKLVVYDILGKEVTTLVNEQKKPGTYEVEWNGTNYSSGLYFYKLIADDVVIDTKKMILLK